jgi:GNAT superfamily N-acetyltransferase
MPQEPARPIIIRRATAADVEGLARLYVEFHNFHARGVPADLVPVGPPDEELRQGIRSLLDNPRCAIFMACDESGEAAGFAEVHLKESAASPAVVQRRYALLQTLAVTESHRRHGLGVRLMAAAEGWAREQGADRMEIDIWEFPEGPLGFYERLGYTTWKRRLVRLL